MATCNPIVPIGNGLASLLIQRMTRKLFKWHRKPGLCEPDEHEDLRHAVVFTCQADDFDLDADCQW